MSIRGVDHVMTNNLEQDLYLVCKAKHYGDVIFEYHVPLYLSAACTWENMLKNVTRLILSSDFFCDADKFEQDELKQLNIVKKENLIDVTDYCLRTAGIVTFPGTYLNDFDNRIYDTLELRLVVRTKELKVTSATFNKYHKRLLDQANKAITKTHTKRKGTKR